MAGRVREVGRGGGKERGRMKQMEGEGRLGVEKGKEMGWGAG